MKLFVPISWFSKYPENGYEVVQTMTVKDLAEVLLSPAYLKIPSSGSTLVERFEYLESLSKNLSIPQEKTKSKRPNSNFKQKPMHLQPKEPCINYNLIRKI